jgi:hypothetical protein
MCITPKFQSYARAQGSERTLNSSASFPEKYRAAVVRAAEGCKIVKTIAADPAIEVVAHTEDAIAHA